MANLKKRYLEIGPGKETIPNFETFNLGLAEKTDGNIPMHLGDARSLPFENHTFDVVYSSHCIEHIHWWEIESTIKEWSRVVKTDGSLEVWTVDGYKIMKELISLEETGKINQKFKKNWQEEKTKGDTYLWLVGRILSYPRSGEYDSNLHRAIITPIFLINCFKKAGLKDIRLMDRSEVRGYDHGWINLGVKGTK